MIKDKTEDECSHWQDICVCPVPQTGHVSQLPVSPYLPEDDLLKLVDNIDASLVYLTL